MNKILNVEDISVLDQAPFFRSKPYSAEFEEYKAGGIWRVYQLMDLRPKYPFHVRLPNWILKLFPRLTQHEYFETPYYFVVVPESESHKRRKPKNIFWEEWDKISFNSRQAKLEDVLEEISEATRTEILFHLNIFRHS